MSKEKVGPVAVALGYDGTVAVLIRPPKDGVQPVNDASLSSQNILKLMSPSSIDDPYGYCPPECMILCGPQLPTLRDLLNTHYPPTPENPDLIAMMQAEPRLALTWSLPVYGSQAESAARAIINDFGKVFYDRGFDVESQIDRTGVDGLVLKVHIKSKEDKK